MASTAFVAGLVYYVAARGWQLKRDMPGYSVRQELDLRDLGRLGRLETGLLKGLAALFLVALAAQFWVGRYELCAERSRQSDGRRRLPAAESRAALAKPSRRARRCWPPSS